LLHDTLAEQEATIHAPALAATDLASTARVIPSEPPIQLAAAVPLHGIYSIDDWAAVIPKKNRNETTRHSNLLAARCPMPPRLVQDVHRLRRFSAGRS
jgi:hypothetical protein